MPERYQTHAVLLVHCSTMRIEFRVKVRNLPMKFARCKKSIREKIHFCRSILGMGHSLSVQLHFFQVDIHCMHSVNPVDGACIIFVSIKSHFYYPTLPLLHARLGNCLPNQPKSDADRSNDEEQGGKTSGGFHGFLT